MSRNEAGAANMGCNFHRQCLRVLPLFMVFNFVILCKEVGSSLNDCFTPLHIKEWGTTDKEPCLSLPPAGWLAGKEKSLHVGEGSLGGMTVKSRVKTKLVPGAL